jgi:hypothetical protein
LGNAILTERIAIKDYNVCGTIGMM